MDDVARFNRERWEALVRAGVPYSRPALDLDRRSARAMVDPEGILDDVSGWDVLCLAGGGGQQSAAFGLLGARVTVLDLSEGQLDRDRQAAEHYGLTVRAERGDMRDLGRFPDDAFDIVWHAHSLNFVPDSRPVLDGVARVLRPGGLYRLSCWNPFVHGAAEEWDGTGYRLRRPYADGAEIVYDDPDWEVAQPDGTVRRVAGPREFRHGLGTLVNGLLDRGFALLGLWEGPAGDAGAEPGSWAHFTSIAPPWLTFWARRGPGT
jgi:SAM-dependent methyltransferase